MQNRMKSAKKKMKSGANPVEEMNGSGCRPSPTPAGGSLALAAQLILIQSFSYHLSFLFVPMLFIFDTLNCLNFVWWSLLLELKKIIITMVLSSFIDTEAKRKGSI